MPFPKQEERKKCWASKDAYWQCLADNNEEKSKCIEQRKAYEASCIKQWVTYFDRRRDYLKFKEKVESGQADEIREEPSKSS